MRIARSNLTRIELFNNHGREFKELMNGMDSGLRTGIQMMFSPWAPVGVVTIPGTPAWGAAAAPFCLPGDL